MDEAVGGRDAPVVSELTGLTAAEVAHRQAQGLSNDVPLRASRSLVQIIRANVFTRINALIAVLFGIIAIIGPVQDGLFALVIVINTLIGIVQELRAKRTLDRLAIINATRPRVLRDGELRDVSTREIVVDDVIDFALGDQAVVDGVVVSAVGLEVDESLLTGEAEPVRKRPGDDVLSGSYVVAGRARLRATRVGRDSYAARLTEAASRFTLVRSELREGIDRILRWITWLLIPVGGLLIYSQLVRSADAGHAATQAELSGLASYLGLDLVSPAFADALRGMVAALVTMIPEGLVLLVSIALAVGVVRLGRRGCLVEELPAIEGLARVDVICADKTGTLTEPGMRLREVRTLPTAPLGSAPAEVEAVDVLSALAASDPRPNQSMAAIAAGCPPPPPWPVVSQAPFSSARKWSGVSFAHDEGEHHWILGAPEVVLNHAGSAQGRDPAEILATADEIAGRGARVLLLAQAGDRPDPHEPLPEVRPYALVVLEQRLRADARDTVAYFTDQDVDVKIVSGDTPASVGAVARELNLVRHRAIDAQHLATDPQALADQTTSAAAFGRVSPEGKRSLVRALHGRGHTVAMTGDGVNDVLALKEADVGIAMGSGSPAARSVAQIVLLNNRFAALPRIVAEGRRVIGNIERVATLFLTKTVYSVTVATVVGLLGVAYPFFPRHATLINALTFGIPAFFLALAPNRERARPGFVSRTLRLAIPAGLLAGIATTTTYLLVLGDGTPPDLTDRTAAVITLSVVTMWVLLLVAKPYVWWKVVLVASMGGLLVAVMMVPPAQEFFALDPSDPTKVTIALVVAVIAAAWITVIRIADDRWLDRFLHRGAATPDTSLPQTSADQVTTPAR
ncbi:HAD-IC family P-type ATPase [Lipingzhangella sp. LS1_29]|uniref:HAD-IC family P-type ATPase n=1 Tax=Lipingzhangella rawalii TaxID=2055835 RepID=A0ABU2H282_9ACTN|nr:HAD-IC family P-type ATPase [Lipingzhangella rawalii]MDS1268925.1 HAD-IC family P-type ATPase [Lipingzhangella rawalii]